jgi:hypothetical protein
VKVSIFELSGVKRLYIKRKTNKRKLNFYLQNYEEGRRRGKQRGIFSLHYTPNRGGFIFYFLFKEVLFKEGIEVNL